MPLRFAAGHGDRLHSFPPAHLAYVVRRARKPRNAAIETLIAEIEGEISRYGTLQIAV